MHHPQIKIIGAVRIFFPEEIHYTNLHKILSP